MLKTLRLPNGWATGQALIDYSQGFVKRGLPGEVYRVLHWTGYAAFQRVTLAELGLLLVALFAVGLRSNVGHWAGNSMLPTLFFGSYALTFLVHMVGYADILNVTLLIAIVLVRDPVRRVVLALPLCTLGVLIHENFLLTQFPVVLFTFAIDGLTSATARQRRPAWLRFAVLAAGVTVLTGLVATRGLVSPAVADRLRQSAQTHKDLEPDLAAFAVLSRSFKTNVDDTRRVQSGPLWQRNFSISLANLLPPVALLLWMGFRSLRQQWQISRRTKIWLRFLGALACFSPLSMHVLGWDAMRWNALCTLNTYLTLCALAMQLPASGHVSSPVERHVTVLVLAIGMVSGYALMDDEDINPYPYWPRLQQTYREYKAGGTQHQALP